MNNGLEIVKRFENVLGTILTHYYYYSVWDRFETGLLIEGTVYREDRRQCVISLFVNENLMTLDSAGLQRAQQITCPCRCVCAFVWVCLSVCVNVFVLCEWTYVCICVSVCVSFALACPSPNHQLWLYQFKPEHTPKTSVYRYATLSYRPLHKKP